MAQSPGTVIPFLPKQHSALLPYICALHGMCNKNDRTPPTFLLPVTHEKLLAWWKDRISEASCGERVILLLVDPAAASVPPNKIEGEQVYGLAMLALPKAPSETQTFRATVDVLGVLPKERGKGGARELMRVVEREALNRGRTLLLLDTVTGTPSEEVFKKLGFTAVGSIPKYNVDPEGSPKPCTIFYKNLNG